MIIRVVLFLLSFVIFLQSQQVNLNLGPAQPTQSLEQQAAQRSYQRQLKNRQNIANYQTDGDKSITDEKSAQQKRQFKQIGQRVAKGSIFQDYMFSVQSGQQFIINVPVDQQIALFIILYVQSGSTFTRISDVTKQTPIHVQVYQDNQNLVVNQIFYFLKYIIFQAKQNSTYTARFFSSGTKKFVAMNLKVVTHANYQTKTLKHKIGKYSQQTETIKKDLLGITGSFNRYRTMSVHYINRVIQQTERYCISLLIEVVVGIAVSTVQICMIIKLLRGNSIV